MSRKLLSLFVATLVTVGLMAPALAGGGGGDPDYTISASGPERVTEGADFTASVILDNNGGDLAGWSYGICIDPAEMTANEFGPSDSDTANCGALPGFVTNTIYVDGSGWSQAMVIDLFGLCTLAGGTTGFVTITVDCTMNAPAGSEACMAVCDTLGTPPVAVVVVPGGGSSVPPVTVDDCVGSNEAPQAIPFRRGDSNDDGIVNIADIVWMLAEMFLAGPSTDCVGADDTNSDGTLDAADAVFLASALFSSGPDPAAPGHIDCGLDGDPDPADCATYSSCAP